MVDILKMGSGSLANLQQAMNTTGHNIANVNTEGYSRQSVNFETHDYQRYGFGFMGQGYRISIPRLIRPCAWPWKTSIPCRPALPI